MSQIFRWNLFVYGYDTINLQSLLDNNSWHRNNSEMCTLSNYRVYYIFKKNLNVKKNVLINVLCHSELVVITTLIAM